MKKLNDNYFVESFFNYDELKKLDDKVDKSMI